MAVLPIPAVRTWVPGDSITAARLNSNVRDAVNFLLNPPLFVGYQATGQSIPNNAETAVLIDTVVTDTYSGHSTTVNPSRYTAQVPGWYQLNGKVNFGSTATAGTRAVSFWKNGTAPSPSGQVDVPLAAAYVEIGALQTVQLAVGDYVEMTANQNTGAAITLQGNYSLFEVRWVHQ